MLNPEPSKPSQPGRKQALWTQDEAIAFECAKEVITDMMAICSSQIDEESRKPQPDPQRLSELKTALFNLGREQITLRGNDQNTIAKIRREYGARIRAYRESKKQS
jgi:hypothetical protein